MQVDLKEEFIREREVNMRPVGMVERRVMAHSEAALTSLVRQEICSRVVEPSARRKSG